MHLHTSKEFLFPFFSLARNRKREKQQKERKKKTKEKGISPARGIVRVVKRLLAFAFSAYDLFILLLSISKNYKKKKRKKTKRSTN